MTALAEPAIARHVYRQVKQAWREQGWCVFLSDLGIWWATTTRRPVTIGQSYWSPQHTVLGNDAVTAAEFTELAAKLMKGLEQ